MPHYLTKTHTHTVYIIIQIPYAHKIMLHPFIKTNTAVNISNQTSTCNNTNSLGTYNYATFFQQSKHCSEHFKLNKYV